MTLVVNLFAGPGTGKSTNSALVFGKLKQKGCNVELAHEYAKDLVWEERHGALTYQPYVIAKQMWRIERLVGKVDAIITDSPILFGLIYKNDTVGPAFDEFLFEQHNRWNNLNFYLRRDLDHHPYNPAGRSQTEEGAVALDKVIHRMLVWNKIPFSNIKISDDTADLIVREVEEYL